jgi:hypothetical protein
MTVAGTSDLRLNRHIPHVLIRTLMLGKVYGNHFSGERLRSNLRNCKTLQVHGVLTSCTGYPCASEF